MDFYKTHQIVNEHKAAKKEFMKLKKTKAGFEEIYEYCYKNESPNISIVRLLSSQSYGPLLEKLHIRHYNEDVVRVPPTDDRGDYKNFCNNYYEYKFTIASEEGNINFVQLRPWQKVDYVLEILQPNNILDLYYVPKKEMENLV